MSTMRAASPACGASAAASTSSRRACLPPHGAAPRGHCAAPSPSSAVVLLQQNRPHHHTHQRGPQPARIFNFGGKKNNYERPSVENMGLDYYDKDEVEHYFNYMGCLATEGTYDRMEALLAGGLHPANVILLLASAENDAPKIKELLDAGADLSVKDNNGKGPMDLATKPEVLEMMRAKAGAK